MSSKRVTENRDVYKLSIYSIFIRNINLNYKETNMVFFQSICPIWFHLLVSKQFKG